MINLSFTKTKDSCTLILYPGTTESIKFISDNKAQCFAWLMVQIHCSGDFEPDEIKAIKAEAKIILKLEG